MFFNIITDIFELSLKLVLKMYILYMYIFLA